MSGMLLDSFKTDLEFLNEVQLLIEEYDINLYDIDIDLHDLEIDLEIELD